MFDYDKSRPLNVEEARVEEREQVMVREVLYASPLGGKVPAYLVFPRRGSGDSAAPARSLAAVLFLHHGFGNRYPLCDGR